MPDKGLVLEILVQAQDAVTTVIRRSEVLVTVEDFLRDDEGLEKLDAICMKLIAIGESLKNVDRLTHGRLLDRNSDVDWKKVIGMRDVISHHYFDLDAEVVFDVCKNHLQPLATAIGSLIAKIEKEGL